jgi:hypothetical protein
MNWAGPPCILSKITLQNSPTPGSGFRFPSRERGQGRAAPIAVPAGHRRWRCRGWSGIHRPGSRPQSEFGCGMAVQCLSQNLSGRTRCNGWNMLHVRCASARSIRSYFWRPVALAAVISLPGATTKPLGGRRRDSARGRIGQALRAWRQPATRLPGGSIRRTRPWHDWANTCRSASSSSDAAPRRAAASPGRRTMSRKQVAALVGVAPYAFESGKFKGRSWSGECRGWRHRARIRAGANGRSRPSP